MKTSLSYNGGYKNYSNIEKPENKNDVIQILQKFIKDKFTEPEAVVDEISRDDRHIIKFENPENKNFSLKNQGDTIVVGSFVYPAKNHSIQKIWENKFEIRETNEGLLVNVKSWEGSTVESWTERKEKNKIW